jgi:hypothetical protein
VVATATRQGEIHRNVNVQGTPGGELNLPRAKGKVEKKRTRKRKRKEEENAAETKTQRLDPHSYQH